MSRTITPISLRYLFRVNCYLVAADDGYVLIDTGLAPRREVLEEWLREAGCEPGSLRLIILTHGHTDHAGNCAHLRKAYGAPIAMHAADVGKVARGDMFWSPEGGRALATTVARTTLALIGLGRSESFEPDVLLADGQGLDEYGLDAEIIHFPGHTPGSLGVRIRTGDLFCGDLLTNTRKPVQNSMVEAAADEQASVARLNL